MPENSDILTYKIILLGNSWVGKTSLVKKYIQNIFDENPLSTIGVNFSFKELTLKNKRK